MMIRPLLALGAFLSIVPLHAADGAASLANEFVRLLRYNEQYGEYQRACVKGTSAISAESLVSENPDRFGGIRPGTRLWPQVIAAYDEYFRDMCARPTEAEFLAALAAAYSSNLSPEELRDAIKFYSSAVGQRLIAAHRIAASAVYSEWARLNAQHAPTANARFDKRIEELARRHNERR